VIHQILGSAQIEKLAKEDYEEAITRWGGMKMNVPTNLHEKDDFARIQISGNADIDHALLLEHELYKHTGSIHAQARIDCWIIPCILSQQLQRQGVGGTQPNSRCKHQLRQGRWMDMLLDKTEIQRVLQYYSLPDLSIYIRERMLSSSMKAPSFAACAGGRTQDKYLSGTCRAVSMHQCCQGVGEQGEQHIMCVAACTSCGCIHGSILTLLFGSMLPLANKITQCRKLHLTQSCVKSSIECCTLLEYTILCILVQALLMGLYPQGHKTAIFDVRVNLHRR